MEHLIHLLKLQVASWLHPLKYNLATSQCLLYQGLYTMVAPLYKNILLKGIVYVYAHTYIYAHTHIILLLLMENDFFLCNLATFRIYPYSIKAFSGCIAFCNVATLNYYATIFRYKLYFLID